LGTVALLLAYLLIEAIDFSVLSCFCIIIREMGIKKKNISEGKLNYNRQLLLFFIEQLHIINSMKLIYSNILRACRLLVPLVARLLSRHFFFLRRSLDVGGERVGQI